LAWGSQITKFSLPAKWGLYLKHSSHGVQNYQTLHHSAALHDVLWSQPALTNVRILNHTAHIWHC